MYAGFKNTTEMRRRSDPQPSEYCVGVAATSLAVPGAERGVVSLIPAVL
jgi:hypothetical protein